MNDEAEGIFGSLEDVPTRPGRWVDLVSGGALRTWRECSYAKRASRRAVQVYREVELTKPELSGLTRYKEVVSRQTGLDDTAVRRILAGAESSFAAWPVERELRFRDVVQYLVISKCLADEPNALGTRTRLTAIIESEVPENY
jgi:hypothetical protein